MLIFQPLAKFCIYDIRMKNISVILFLLLLFGCSKHKLKQPCTIHLSTKFVPQGNVNDVMYSGDMNVSRITFSGERKEGTAVEIEQEFENGHFELVQNQSLAICMDVPVGTYHEFEFKLRLDQDNSLDLIKANYGPTSKPILIRFSDDLNLKFRNTEKSPELRKKEDYNCVLIWDFGGLLAGISNIDIENGETQMIDGVEHVVMSNTTNHDLFIKVKGNLKESMRAKFE